MQFSGIALRLLIRWSFLVMNGLIALALIGMVGGLSSLPYAGWGAAYAVAASLWLLGAAALAGLSWLGGAVTFRAKQGWWYFGIGNVPERN